MQQADGSTFPLTTRSPGWLRTQRSWRGLTQVSRQVRTEFLSLQASTKMHVDIDNLERYLRILAVQAGSNGMSEVRANLVLHHDNHESINLYDAIVLPASMPQINIVWYEPYEKSEAAILCPRFCEYVTKNATRVEVSASIIWVPNRNCITSYKKFLAWLYLRREVAAPWMKSPGLQSNFTALTAWTKEVCGGKTADHILPEVD